MTSVVWSLQTLRCVEKLPPESRRSPFGDCGRWVVTVLRSTARRGHHHGVTTAPRRNCQEGSALGENVLEEALQERSGPTLSSRGRGRARLVVLPATVGGRWSQETAQFLRGFALLKSERTPELLRDVQSGCGQEFCGGR